jgi:NTP pyrophosphatase (non-canonical NTP hydrolase)
VSGPVREWGTLLPNGNVCEWPNEAMARASATMSETFPGGAHPLVYRDCSKWSTEGESATTDGILTGDRLSALSAWIDGAQGDRDAEAVTWGRLAKIAEETGEVIEAFVGATGQNPRKGVTHTLDDVLKELLDVAVTALAAAEHMTGNKGRSTEMLGEHVESLCKRAGISS